MSGNNQDSNTYIPEQFLSQDCIDVGDPYEYPSGILLKKTIEEGVSSDFKGKQSECFRVLYKVFIAPSSDKEEAKLFQENSEKNYLEFVPNDKEKMPAIEIAVLSMNENEKARLFVSHHYGFSKSSYVAKDGSKLPPNSNLIVELHLVQILGESMISGKSKDMYKHILKESDLYEGPNVFSSITADVSLIYNNEIVDEYKILNQQIGFSQQIFCGLNKALRTMNKGEISRFYAREKYFVDYFNRFSSKNLEGKNLFFKVELKDFNHQVNFYELDFNEKISQAELMISKANDLVKNDEIYKAIQGYKYIRNQIRSQCNIDDDQSEENTSSENIEKNEPSKENSDEVALKKNMKCKILFRCDSNLSLCYMKQKKLHKALEKTKCALEIEPKNVKVLSRKAKILLDQKESDKALIALEEILSIDSSNIFAMSNKSSVLEQIKRNEELLKKQYQNMWRMVGTDPSS